MPLSHRLVVPLIALLAVLALTPSRGAAAEPETTDGSAIEQVDPDAKLLVLRLTRRAELIKAHRSLASISVLTMLVAQGFGIFNHAALDSGQMTRDQLAPTLMTHRIAVTTTVSTYFVAGLLAWTMPGPDGAPASRKPFPSLVGGRRVHVALSIAHGLAMAATIALGAVSSFATRDTPAWNATVTAHHVAAATTTVLLVVAIGARSGS